MDKIGKMLEWFRNLPHNATNWLGNVLLLVMFILILLIGADSVFQAYLDLHYANSKINQTLSEVKAHLQDLSAKGAKTKKLTPESESFFARLESTSRKGLDSNAISFLFQVFSLTLVSAGVYLLNRSHQNVIVAQKKVELIGPFVDNALITSTIMGYLLVAYQNSWLLRGATSEEAIAEYIALERDSITVLRNEIRQALRNRKGIEPSHRALLIDVVTKIIENLGKFSNKMRVQELIDVCDECARALKQADWVESYYKNLDRLLDKDIERVK